MRMMKKTFPWRAVWLVLILALGLGLRHEGLRDPILDHPGWRQGDTASIARNFAVLQYNILYPQTNYDGPPPNYVELELQIVPFLAATLYKVVGVHPVIGRVITIVFSLATVVVLYFFGRRVFRSEAAGLVAAAAYAIMPGSVYYGRTFTPDATMVFFMTAALYAVWVLALETAVWSGGELVWVTALLALAFLAKPVSLAALVPAALLLNQRRAEGRRLVWWQIATLIVVPLGILFAYDRFVSAHAEWHWASGITRLHVIPSLLASLHSVAALHAKVHDFHVVLGMLGWTMIGPICCALGAIGLAFVPARARPLIWGWVAGGLAYTYVVVTVERVDYYMFLLLPLAALCIAALAEPVRAAVTDRRFDGAAKAVLAGAGLLALAGTTYENRRIVQPYYHYSARVYRDAVALRHELAPGALVVMGHYDPSVLYYIGHYGWEEDPYLWTPFDEESAIRKGARYYIAIERNRFDKNVELCAWMQRFPVLNPHAQWPVYVTDPARELPGADAQWRAFRAAERAGRARGWLDAHHVCMSGDPRRPG